MPLPPQVRDERADGVGENIQRIAGRMLQDAGANPFKQHGPEDEMPEDLAACRRGSARSQPEPFVDNQQRRQRARDEQHVIEPAGEEIGLQVWLYQPAIHDVERTADEDERIAQETKRTHSRASMMAPKPAASASLMQSDSMTRHINAGRERGQENDRKRGCD